MSIKIMNLIWEVAPYRGNTLLTFLALGDWSNDEGVCWPRLDTLAKKSRQSVRSAQYALEELERDDMVVVVVNPGRGHQNAFMINTQKLHQLRSDEKVQFTPEKVQNGTLKGAKRDSVIRKNHQEPPKNQTTPIVPAERGLTARQRQNLSKELQHIYGSSVGANFNDEFDDRALRTACMRLCLPLDLARKAIAESEGKTA